MRFSTIFGAIFATAAIAAPFANNDWTDVKGDHGLSTTGNGHTKGHDIVNDNGVHDLLNDLLGKTDHIKATVTAIVVDVNVEVDVEGILYEVEKLVGELLEEVHELLAKIVVGLELSGLDPLVVSVSVHVQGVVDVCGGIVVKEPVLAALLSEITGTLATVLSILGGIHS